MSTSSHTSIVARCRVLDASFVRLGSRLLRSLLGSQSPDDASSVDFLPLVLSLPSDPSSRYYTSFNGGLLPDSDADGLHVPSFIADALKIASGDSINLSIATSAPLAAQVHFKPLTPDDWDLIELNADHLEAAVLASYSVVFPGQVVQLKLRSNFVAEATVNPFDDLELLDGSRPSPPPPCARLVSGASVVVYPYPRSDAASSPGPPPSGRSGPLRLQPSQEDVQSLKLPPRDGDGDGGGRRLDVRQTDEYVFAPQGCVLVHPSVLSSLISVVPLPLASLPPSLTVLLCVLPSQATSSSLPPLPVVARASLAVLPCHAVLPPSLRSYISRPLFSCVELRVASADDLAAFACRPQDPVPRPKYDDDSFRLAPERPFKPSSPVQSAAFSSLVSSYSSYFSASAAASPSPSAHRLLFGAPGSGKSHVSLCVAHHLRLSHPAHAFIATVHVSCRSLKQQHLSSLSSCLRALTSAAATACRLAPSLLILDDLDALCPSSAEDERRRNTDAEKDDARLVAEHVRWLLSELQAAQPSAKHVPEGKRPAVRNVVGALVTAADAASLNSALFEDPDLALSEEERALTGFGRAEREEVLQNMLEHAGLMPPSKAEEAGKEFFVDVQSAGRATDGYLPGDLELLVERAGHFARLRALGRVVDDCPAERGPLLHRDLEKAMEGFLPVAMIGAKLHKSDIDWDDIGGLFDTKNKLLDMIENPTKYKKIYENSPIKNPKGCLLYGPSGCGKTLLGSAIARKCGLNFIIVKGPELLDRYIGASEAAVRDVFQRAEMASPCVIFFDEFESLAPKRGKDATGVTDRVVNQLLTFLDGVEVGTGTVYVIAASSRPDMIDPALLRPGRIDQRLLVNFPRTVEEKMSVLNALVRRGEMRVEEGLISDLFSSDEYLRDVELNAKSGAALVYTAADLSAILGTAHLEAVHEALAEQRRGEDKEQPPKILQGHDIVIRRKHLVATLMKTRPSGKFEEQKEKQQQKKSDQKTTCR